MFGGNGESEEGHGESNQNPGKKKKKEEMRLKDGCFKIMKNGKKRRRRGIQRKNSDYMVLALNPAKRSRGEPHDMGNTRAGWLSWMGCWLVACCGCPASWCSLVALCHLVVGFFALAGWVGWFVSRGCSPGRKVSWLAGLPSVGLFLGWLAG